MFIQHEITKNRYMNEPYYSFNRYLRRIFGERVHRISIDAGFKCPNINGHLSAKGCIYCNNKGFSLYAGRNIDTVTQIKNSIKYYKEKAGIKKFIAYFQPFSNTYADIDILREKYDIIKGFPEIVGLSISTRPDCVDEKKMRLISSYAKDYLLWIEYGLQTTHAHALSALNRNHTYGDFLKAVSLARNYNIQVGVHMIIGLPCLSYDETMQDALRLSACDIQGIKFHALHVFKDTTLYQIYNKGELKLIEKETYIKILCDFLERIPDNIVILRLISTANTEQLVAPLWINDKNFIIKGVNDEFLRRKSKQGIYYSHKI